jgi:hypothetical protein
MGWSRATAAFAIAAQGCSLIVSTSGLSGGGTDALNEHPDASDDAPTQPDGDAGPLSFCAALSPQPTFCADFDQVANVDDGWSNGGGTIGSVAFDDKSFSSAPRSAVFSLPGGSAMPAHGNRFNEAFKPPTAPSKVRLSFDTFVDMLDSNGGPVHLAGVSFHGYDIEIGVRAASALTIEGLPNGTFVPGAFTKAVPIGKWTTIVMTLDFTTNHVLITVDGDSARDAALGTGARSDPAPSLQIGAAYYDLTAVTDTKVHIDNVVVNLD